MTSDRCAAAHAVLNDRAAPDRVMEDQMDEETVEVITALAEAVRKSPRRIGKMSVSEGLAAALVLDDQKLLGRTMLEAVDRIGPDWFECALEAQRRARQRDSADTP